MIGLIDCRTQDPGKSWAGIPLEMLEFFDRPLLQHAVEQMVQAGVTHCVLVTEDTSAVMERWGEGERWGCTFSAIRPHAIVSFLAGLERARIMVGRGDCIPCISGLPLAETSSRDVCLVFTEYLEDGTRKRMFTGWAVLPPSVLLEQCFATHGADGLLPLTGAHAVQVTTCIRSETPTLFLRSQELILEAVESAVIFHGMEQRPGVWTARNATVHPSVQIIGRVFVGENVRVQPGVTLVGPVVICRDAIIDAGSMLTDASVQPGIYIGRASVLLHDVAMEGTVVRAGQGLTVKVEDPRRLANTAMPLLSYLRALWKLKSQRA